MRSRAGWTRNRGPGTRLHHHCSIEHVLTCSRIDFSIATASRTLTITANQWLLATFDGKTEEWRLTSGTYRVALGKSAGELVSTAQSALTGRSFGK
jgi:hypothetical protein